MKWNNVQEFAHWWLRNRPIKPPFEDVMFITDNAHSLTLFRDGRFQVELYLIKPNTESPFHSHPGVDSFFMYLAGNIEFGDDNLTFTDVKPFDKPSADGKSHMLYGKTAVAMEGSPHAVRALHTGGAFLSFEYWRDKDPRSVVIHWEGQLDGPTHTKTVNETL
jgi:hypothetical protein